MSERRRIKIIEVVLVALFIAIVAGFLLRRRAPEEKTIDSMSESERRAIYDKEIAAFRALCIEGPGSEIPGRCRDRAEFLRQFPECDESCRSQTDRFTSYPTR